MTDDVRLVCPKCKSPNSLWAEASFPGWHSVDVTIGTSYGRSQVFLAPVERGRPYYEVTHHRPEDLQRLEMGCSACDWEGGSHDLLQLGIDGEPLATPNPNQLHWPEVSR